MDFLRLIAISVVLLVPTLIHAEDLEQTVQRLEGQLDARIGVAVRDSGTGETWSHRSNERFLMNSTVKVLVCAAALSLDDLELSETVQIHRKFVVGHAPVTRHRVGLAMTVSEACFAAIDQSDNGATNALFDKIGGPGHLTAFLRDLGDDVTRSDRTEPSLNTFVPGDSRDTTTPTAMVRTLQELLVGDVLSPERRNMLAVWMRPGNWTSALIRPHVPGGWMVSDKSGSGRNNRNLIAMLSPPTGATIFVSLSISDTTADFGTRTAALAELSSAVMEMILNK